jgi:hypothetical protein
MYTKKLFDPKNGFRKNLAHRDFLLEKKRENKNNLV